MHNEVIFSGNRAIIPKLLWPDMVTRINANHLGAETCLYKARNIIYWPTISSKIKDFISNRTACSHYLQSNSKELLISHPVPNKPWTWITRDIININYSRLLLRLLGSKRTAKRSKMKLWFHVIKESSGNMEYMTLLFLIMLDSLIAKCLSNVQKDDTLNRAQTKNLNHQWK